MNLGWVSYNVNEIPLETIFDSDNKFCFLVGSGISLEKPSCLPTGYQFVKNLLILLRLASFNQLFRSSESKNEIDFHIFINLVKILNLIVNAIVQDKRRY